MIPATITQGDILLPWTETLYVDGQKIDLTGSSVSLSIRSYTSGIEVTRTATTFASFKHKATYTPIAADVANPGVYDVQWRVTKSAKTVSVPAKKLTINPKIGT